MGKMICSRCGSTQMVPDPHRQCETAKDENGAPWMCMGTCREIEDVVGHNNTPDAFLRRYETLKQLIHSFAYYSKMLLEEVGPIPDREIPEPVHKGPCTSESMCDMECTVRFHALTLNTSIHGLQNVIKQYEEWK